MKHFITMCSIVLVFISSLTIFAQDVSNLKYNESGFSFDVKIKSPSFKISKLGKFDVRDYKEFDGLSKNGLKIPYKKIIIAIPPNSKPNIAAKFSEKVTIPNTLVRSIKEDEISTEILKRSDIVNSYENNQTELPLIEIEKYFWWRDYYCVQVRINFLEFNPVAMSLTEYNDIEIKLSFSEGISIAENEAFVVESEFDRVIQNTVVNSEFAKSFKSKHAFSTNDESGDWIDYAKTYVKLGTATDDIYRLYGTDFAAMGISLVEVDPQTMKMYNSGELYPIYVFGAGDGSFDENDYVEFYGHKNYNDESYRVPNIYGREYVDYLNRYSDLSVFFLTWGGAETNFVTEQSTSTDGVNETLEYYTYFEHMEENLMYQTGSISMWRNQDPEWTETNSWYRDWLNTGEKNFNFTVEDKQTNSTAKFYSKLFSAGSNVVEDAHNIVLEVNGIRVDSQTVNRNNIVVLNGELNSNLLNNGTNTLTVDNLDNGTSPNSFGYDWYEVEYEKLLKAVNDSLIFQFKAAMVPGLKTIKVTNIQPGEYLIYKVKPNLVKIVAYTIQGTNLLFADNVSQGDKYIIVKASNYKSPAYSYRKNFVNLRNSQRQNDYLIISNTELINGVIQYSEFINNNYDVNASYVFVEDIFDEFDYGYPYPESIKSFLMKAYDTWQSPKLTYVTIIGSGCFDYKNFTRADRYINKNLVPSFGEPVSDTWFTIWEDLTWVPQLFVGRIPVLNSNQLEAYLLKHQQHLDHRMSKWNKRAMFFSGGIDDNEFDFFRQINDEVIAESITIEPLRMKSLHFYKTVTPPTNFGPFSSQFIANEFDEGAGIISYIGHSGTEIWDNSIENYDQLDNKYDFHPLITDFGCSTGKFGQADIFCFGTVFVNQGSSINYIGNSSLGSFGTAEYGSKHFYSTLLGDVSAIPRVGEAHVLSKIIFNDRIFTLTSTLFGDPIISLKIPNKPNVQIYERDIIIGESSPNEEMDSLQVKIMLNSFGTYSTDSLSISITDYNNNLLVYSLNKRIKIPEYIDSLSFKIPIKGLPGNHLLSFQWDVDNEIDEIYEDDNQITREIYVGSQNIKYVSGGSNFSSYMYHIKLLNSSVNPGLVNNNIITKVTSLNASPTTNWIITPIDTFYTKINFATITRNNPYLIKSGFVTGDTVWTSEKSIYYGDVDSKYYLNDSLSFLNQSTSSAKFEDGGMVIENDEVLLNVLSTGFPQTEGHVYLDGQPTSNISYGWGMGITVLDGVTFEVDNAGFYNFPEVPAKADELAELIESIEAGKIVIMNVYHDGLTNLTARLRTAINSLGGTLINSLPITGAWILIGGKNLNAADVYEDMGNGGWDGDSLFVDRILIKPNELGSFTTETISGVDSWNNIELEYTTLNSSAIEIYPIVETNQTPDTLSMLGVSGGIANLSVLNNNNHRSAKFLVKMLAGPNGDSPKIYSMDIKYDGAAELGTNYQAVWLDQDSVTQGDNQRLSFYAYNVGDATANNFNVQVELVNADNSRESIFEQQVTSLSAEERELFIVNFDTSPTNGNKQFFITIDPGNTVTELFEDNNFFSIPFFIKADTTGQSVDLTFDGIDIFDGDYVAAEPVIKVEVSNRTAAAITDTSAVDVFLNNQRIYYSQNIGVMSYSFSPVNPKFTLEYRPQLEDGEYTLKILSRDADGNLDDPAGTTKSFLIEDDAKLMYTYNYPNPFADDTYFTFKLTQIPDDLTIRIYTVAGRLIREITRTAADLNIDFNRIHWDGKDEDGDLIANGVYLYKIAITKDGNVETVTQKLTVMK